MEVVENDPVEVVLGLLRCLLFRLAARLALCRRCLTGDGLPLLSSELVELERVDLSRRAPGELLWKLRCCLRALWRLVMRRRVVVALAERERDLERERSC